MVITREKDSQTQIWLHLSKIGMAQAYIAPVDLFSSSPAMLLLQVQGEGGGVKRRSHQEASWWIKILNPNLTGVSPISKPQRRPGSQIPYYQEVLLERPTHRGQQRWSPQVAA